MFLACAGLMISFAGTMPDTLPDFLTEDHLSPYPEQIDLNGDTWLAVRQTPNGRILYRLRVSRALLSFASSYFRALFGPHFLEGPATQSAKDVEMLEEKAWAFTTLMKVIHMCSDFAKPFPPGYAMNFAAIVDKYDCAKAVRLSLGSLMPVKQDTKSIYSGCLLINAAYLLDSPELFTKYTADMVTNFGPHDLVKYDYLTVEPAVPAAVYGAYR